MPRSPYVPRGSKAEPRVTYASQLDIHNAGQDARDAYQRGIDCLNARDFAGALPELLEAIRLDPVVSHSHNDLGVAYLLQGDSEQAVAPLQTAIRLRPGNGPSHLNLAGALQGLGRYAEAIGHLELALVHDPGLEASVQPQLEACRASLDDDSPE